MVVSPQHLVVSGLLIVALGCAPPTREQGGVAESVTTQTENQIGPPELAAEQVAFCAVEGDTTRLYIVNLDGSGLHKLSDGPEDGDPVWSPDGSLVAFVRVLGHKEGESRSDAGIWIVRADGAGLRQLTSGPNYDADIVWSGDGTSLNFYRQGDRPGRYSVALDGTQLRADPATYDYGYRSPRGKAWAYIRPTTDGEDEHHGDLWITDDPMKNGRRITKLEASMGIADWSPSGDRLLLLVEEGMDMDLWAVSMPSGTMSLLASGKKTHYHDAVYSPDGGRIAYLESLHEEPMTNASFRQLYVMDAGGKNKRQLTDHWADDYTPMWTRDGNWIVVQGTRGLTHSLGGVSGTHKSCIVAVKADGSGERVLSLPFDAYGLSLRP